MVDVGTVEIATTIIIITTDLDMGITMVSLTPTSGDTVPVRMATWEDMEDMETQEAHLVWIITACSSNNSSNSRVEVDMVASPTRMTKSRVEDFNNSLTFISSLWDCMARPLILVLLEELQRVDGLDLDRIGVEIGSRRIER